MIKTTIIISTIVKPDRRCDWVDMMFDRVKIASVVDGRHGGVVAVDHPGQAVERLQRALGVVVELVVEVGRVDHDDVRPVADPERVVPPACSETELCMAADQSSPGSGSSGVPAGAPGSGEAATVGKHSCHPPKSAVSM